MTDGFGYAGKMLRVDLSSGAISHIPTMDYADRFLGGRGIATKIYWDEVSPQTKAFDPENRLIFITGPLAGVTPGVAGIRWLVCGKSPITAPEQFCYANFGGNWGTELKLAGYDGIIVQGKSDKPVFLSIQDDSVEIRDASALWGKSTIEVRDTLKGELGKQTKVVATGPAGDNMVLMAILLADNDASGTSGFGAVMGSKKLKAIAVKGSGKVTVAEPEKLLELTRYIRELRKTTPRSPRPSTDVPLVVTPKKKKLDVCRNCGLGGCQNMFYEAENGKKARFMCGPQWYYQIRSQRYYGGEACGEVPFLAAVLNNEYGLDSNAIELMIAWLSRCYQAGVLTDENTGIPLSKMGSLEFIEALVKKIALREGFGDTLAHGTVRAAELVGNGADKLITDYILKAGQHAVYNGRFYITTALLYAMEPRQPIQQLHEMSGLLGSWVQWVNGAEGAYISTEVFRAIAKRFWGSELAADFSTYEGKALAATKIQDREYAKESLILCDRIWPIKSVEHSQDHVGDPTLESKVYSAVVGKEVDEEGLNRIGERIVNMQRAIFAREATGTDTIPDFHFTIPQKTVLFNPEAIAPGKDGEIFVKKGALLDRKKFAEMKREFYQLRGWDAASGRQTRAKLADLDLKDIAEDLVKRGLAV